LVIDVHRNEEVGIRARFAFSGPDVPTRRVGDQWMPTFRAIPTFIDGGANAPTERRRAHGDRLTGTKRVRLRLLLGAMAPLLVGGANCREAEIKVA
jgi:hypothetical protein